MVKKSFLMLIILFALYSTAFAKDSTYKKFGSNTPIAGEKLASQNQMMNLILLHNKTIDKDILSYLVKMYVVESSKEGINTDIAFSQMVLETNYLRFGNDVHHNQNNFAGLGVVKSGVTGHGFDTIYLGIRSHIQHLAAYALTTPLKQDLVDPRFKYVTRGSATTLKALTGKWAADLQYDKKIFKILTKLVKMPDTYTH